MPSRERSPQTRASPCQFWVLFYLFFANLKCFFINPNLDMVLDSVVLYPIVLDTTPNSVVLYPNRVREVSSNSAGGSSPSI